VARPRLNSNPPARSATRAAASVPGVSAVQPFLGDGMNACYPQERPCARNEVSLLLSRPEMSLIAVVAGIFTSTAAGEG
jgi:hypothetical protein